MMLLCPCLVNMLNFCQRHTGKVSGLLMGLTGSGALVFALIYPKYFSDQNGLRNFWLFLAVLYFVLNLLATFFMRDYSHLVVRCDSECAPLKNSFDSTNGKDSYESGDERSQDMKTIEDGITGLELAKSLNFHLLCWAFLITGAVHNLIRTNAVLILTSFRHDDLITPLLSAAPVVAAFLKIFLGVLSDKLIHLLPRSSYISVLIWYEVVIVYISCGYGDDTFLTINLIMLCYGVDSVSISTTVAVASELFGRKNISVNVGLLFFGYGIVCIPVLLAFGLVSDGQTNNSFCFGVRCFSEIFLVSGAGLTLTGALFSVLSYREWVWRKSLNR